MDHGQVGSHIPMSVGATLSSKDAEMLEAENELTGTLSDDEDSLGEEEGFGPANLIHSSGIEDEIAESLTAVGTMPGLAAAAAVASRRRQRPHRFETNPSTRKRQYTRLLRKLKHTMHEFCTRCGQQAVLLCVSPGKDNPSFKVFGASPLDQVLRGRQNVILNDLERQLQEKAPAFSNRNVSNLFELPPLVIDGIPTTLEKMNQAQLRMFVPEMLKYSTGRGKPGWGRDSTRPPWWPLDVPWANVRRDVRTDDQKIKVPWTLALRQIVRNCYSYHNREDLLNCFPDDPPDMQIQESRPDERETYCAVTQAVSRPSTTNSVNVPPPTLVQTVQNSDGSVSLVQLDSGQTIATITQDQTGQAVATLATQDTMDGTLAVTMHQVNSTQQWSISTTDSQQAASGVTATVVQSQENGNTILVERDQEVVLEPSPSNITLLPKHTREHLQEGTHTIGLSLNDTVCQTVEALQGTSLPTGSRIILSAGSEGLDEHGSTAMVQIPASVYEKIANSIQDTNLASVVRRISPEHLGHQDKVVVDLDTGQNSPGDVDLESLCVDG